jgi:hypothetical protein
VKIIPVFFVCRIIIDYSQLSDSLKDASDVKQAVKELGLSIEDTMVKIRTNKPNMKVMLYEHTSYIRD